MDSLVTISSAFVLADIKMALGQLHAAASTYEHALQLAVAHGKPMPVGTEDVYTGISKLHRERGDLAAATQDLVTSKKLGEQVEIPDWQYRWCIAQAQLQVTLGNLDNALDLLDEAQRRYVRTPIPNVRSIDKPTQTDPLKTKTSEFEWIDPLSERELEILQLIADGLTNRAIADRLYLSLNTVKVHIRNIYGKLGVHSRTQAVSKARDLEILPS